MCQVTKVYVAMTLNRLRGGPSGMTLWMREAGIPVLIADLTGPLGFMPEVAGLFN